MPRSKGRHHSSSTGSYNDAIACAAQPSKSTSSAETLAACNKLFGLLPHLSSGCGGSDKAARTNFLHQIMSCGGSSNSTMSDVHVNELSIAHALLERAAQLDRMNAAATNTAMGQSGGGGGGGGGAVSASGKKKGSGSNSKRDQAQQQPQHLRTLLLTAESESNYTPLHSAMYCRKLRPILLLLRHAAQSSAGLEENDIRCQVGGRMKLHPILMLDGNNINGSNNRKNNKQLKRAGSGPSSVTSGGSGGGGGSLLHDMVLARDAEGLTPLDLLCQSMSSDLAKCRRYLDNVRFFSSSGGGGGRDRSVSLVDEEDDSNSSEEDEGNFAGRSRGTSFGNIHDVDLDATDGPFEVLDGNNAAAARRHGNEFAALRDTGRDEGAPLAEDADAPPPPPPTSQDQFLHQPPPPVTYGCEVMTFGRADHCALGVPHFASRRAVEDNVKKSRAGTAAQGGGKVGGSSVRPRRVEAFALGEMGRSFDDNNSDNGVKTHGSAVAVATAAHHTLVATAMGHLMAFGLGKGGRLGTGDENHRPLPTRILGPLSRRRVASIAAAVNHSLCSTSDGGLYSWGSNRFGQLGISTGSSKSRGNTDASDIGTTTDQRCLPRRVDDLRHDFIVAVAAGDRHSVALTRRGEVYTWGDNRAGQLGMTLRGESRGKNGSPGSSNSGCDRPNRVDALWTATPKRRVASIAAAEQSTLVLVLPARLNESSGTSSLPVTLPVNSVYSWGHGNPVPVKVNFPSPDLGKATGKLQRHGRFSGMNVNPTSISAAKHHNAAITSNGWVYTWGLHSEPLGMAGGGDNDDEWESNDRKRTSSLGSMVIASPQLVTRMLPENGGGLAVAVSASENHTAVLTDCGHLYTWGANEKSGALGHEGVKWQPVPRRVPGVHRAVGLAAAKEHTALLIGTSFPFVPKPRRLEPPANAFSSRPLEDQPSNVPSLQELATRNIAKHVDLFNALPLLITAERMGCKSLISYCTDFITKNLDAVLALGKKTNLDMYLDESISRFLSRPDSEDERDAALHPLALALARAGSGPSGEVTSDWMDKCPNSVQSLPRATLAKASPRSTTPYIKKSRALLELKPVAKAMEACTIVGEEAQLSEEDMPVENVTAKLEAKDDASKSKEIHEAAPADTAEEAPKSDTAASSSRYRCELCKVTCPDENAYAMHMGGKKHRNRAQQKVEEEKEEAIAALASAKRRQMLATDQVEASFDAKPEAAKSPWKKDAEPSIQPKYRLKPPPPPCFESKAAAAAAQKSSRSQSTKAIPSWSLPAAKALSSRTTKKPASFQDILEEEQRSSKAKKLPPPHSYKSNPTSRSPASSSWNSSNVKSPLKSLIIRQGSQNSASSPASKSIMSLGEFLEPKRPPPKKSTGPAWASGAAAAAAPAKPTQAEPPRHKTSFNEIQRSEEELKAKQDGMCVTGMEGEWYVERRERAQSISAIAAIEEEEREMQLLIEEQKAIEAQIEREQKLKKQKQANKQEKKKPRGDNRRRGCHQGRGRGRGRGRGKKTSASTATGASAKPF